MGGCSMDDIKIVFVLSAFFSIHSSNSDLAQYCHVFWPQVNTSFTILCNVVMLSAETFILFTLMLLIQVFVTENDSALEDFVGENSQNARKFDACMTTLAIRIATAFASLKVHFNWICHMPLCNPLKVKWYHRKLWSTS